MPASSPVSLANQRTFLLSGIFTFVAVKHFKSITCFLLLSSYSYVRFSRTSLAMTSKYTSYHRYKNRKTKTVNNLLRHAVL